MSSCRCASALAAAAASAPSSPVTGVRPDTKGSSSRASNRSSLRLATSPALGGGGVAIPSLSSSKRAIASSSSPAFRNLSSSVFRQLPRHTPPLKRGKTAVGGRAHELRGAARRRGGRERRGEGPKEARLRKKNRGKKKVSLVVLDLLCHSLSFSRKHEHFSFCFSLVFFFCCYTAV